MEEVTLPRSGLVFSVPVNNPPIHRGGGSLHCSVVAFWLLTLPAPVQCARPPWNFSLIFFIRFF